MISPRLYFVITQILFQFRETIETRYAEYRIHFGCFFILYIFFLLLAEMWLSFGIPNHECSHRNGGVVLSYVYLPLSITQH